jgi:hypothetical protein
MGWQQSNLPPTTARLIAEMMQGKTVIASGQQYNEGACYWPGWMASVQNPNRCGILDELVLGTQEALLRDYPEAVKKVRPDPVEEEPAHAPS